MKVDLVYISLFFILSVSLILALHSSYLLYTLPILYFCAILNNLTSIILPNSSFA